MNRRITLYAWLAAAMCAASATMAATPPPGVSVTYDHPEKFTETREVRALAPTRAGDDYMATLKRYIESRAGKVLAPGERLDIVVADIDRAGSFEPWRGGQMRDVRIVKDIYPPRIDLHFRLLDAQGEVIREGSRKLRDPGFLTSDVAAANNDGLRYEKRLVDRWLRNGPDRL